MNEYYEYLWNVNLWWLGVRFLVRNDSERVEYGIGNFISHKSIQGFNMKKGVKILNVSSF